MYEKLKSRLGFRARITPSFPCFYVFVFPASLKKGGWVGSSPQEFHTPTTKIMKYTEPPEWSLATKNDFLLQMVCLLRILAPQREPGHNGGLIISKKSVFLNYDDRRETGHKEGILKPDHKDGLLMLNNKNKLLHNSAPPEGAW